MSVYANNSVHEVTRAVESGTIAQELPPTQIVIVRDGPVDVELQRFLDMLPTTLELWFSGQVVPELTVVPLETNEGLAHALNIGLEHCKYDVVARADADDISLPDRFSSMIPWFAPDQPRLDALGSSIQEFTTEMLNTDDERSGQVRLLPACGEELDRFARMQSPLHHPSVVLRKSSVQQVGGYPENSGRFEDYLLWSRLMTNGCVLRNLPQVLVLYCVDGDAFDRRGGRQMLRDEWQLQRTFRKEKFTSFAQFLRNVVVRAGYRLVPSSWRQKAYHQLVRSRNNAADGDFHDDSRSSSQITASTPQTTTMLAEPTDKPATPPKPRAVESKPVVWVVPASEQEDVPSFAPMNPERTSANRAARAAQREDQHVAEQAVAGLQEDGVVQSFSQEIPALRFSETSGIQRINAQNIEAVIPDLKSFNL
ncbi:hypothetical protein BIFGAL_03983 [Bifidobacterium gallicum DSM 20093 = LMG 11596]|uniref:Glycosyltransferase 2-like domain-containing protein n=2 Tax=Bifidobacterium gallicum DSM 20093 = LMG 11596 TaxID=561180 RepID=D1NVU0_9BIFI|nr:hypothetical protein BIFGAL_03983 [Bifidobacterium gallicum DSM 20093 = LMG 11596]